jgi:hypothetical protein
MVAAIMPGALWVPVRNFTPGARAFPPQGLVLHIAQSRSAAGTLSWMNNPHSDVSSHWVVDKDGTLYQAVSALDRAWCQMAGNAHWWSVENIGYAGEQLTDAQLAKCALILCWLHQQFGTPMQPTDDPTNGFGLGWHGMGGNAWGGHPGCPGDPIVAQREHICAAAQWVNALTHHP